MRDKPTRDQIVPLLARAIELAANTLDPETISSLAKVFQVLAWEFVDHGFSVYLIVGGEDGLRFVGRAPDRIDGTIKLESGALHDIALGRVPAAAAFTGGKLRLEGVPALKLRGFLPLFKPFLDGYRSAWEELCGG